MICILLNNEVHLVNTLYHLTLTRNRLGLKMKSISLKSCLTFVMFMMVASFAYSAAEYPAELAKIIECYPGGEVHNTMKKGNEVSSAILAVGAKENSAVFGFYQKTLSEKGWKVGPEMKNPVMKIAVMEFAKGGNRLNVGLMDYNIANKQGIMINITLEQ